MVRRGSGWRDLAESAAAALCHTGEGGAAERGGCGAPLVSRRLKGERSASGLNAGAPDSRVGRGVGACLGKGNVECERVSRGLVARPPFLFKGRERVGVGRWGGGGRLSGRGTRKRLRWGGWAGTTSKYPEGCVFFFLPVFPVCFLPYFLQAGAPLRLEKWRFHRRPLNLLYF